MDGKVKKLSSKQIVRPNTTNNFYPLVIIETDIVVSRWNFNTQESLEYNLHYKYTIWIRTLALEAPAAIIQLPTSEQLHTRYQVANNVNRLDKE